MAERLIDAEAFLDFLCIEEKIMEGEEITFDYVRSLIVSAPTVEAKPIVHAHWEEFGISKEGIDYICSECAFTISADEYPKNAHYCPWCGAQMDEVVVEENATTKNNTQKVSVDGVKIPVIGMEDVPKLMEE